MSFVVSITSQAKKDLKLIKKRSSSDLSLVRDFLKVLENEGVDGVSSSQHPHKLRGNYKDHWEAHIKPDLLMIWLQFTEDNKIIITRIGSYSDLF